jgi:hypothetical protein
MDWTEVRCPVTTDRIEVATDMHLLPSMSVSSHENLFLEQMVQGTYGKRTTIIGHFTLVLCYACRQLNEWSSKHDKLTRSRLYKNFGTV